MKPIELEVLSIFGASKPSSLTFSYNNRLVNYIYSTWARWEITVFILEGGEEGALASEVCRKSDLSSKGCNKIIDDMVSEGWVIHTCPTRGHCRRKYCHLVASPELKKFWSDYTEYWIHKLKKASNLKQHI